ncbi:glycosyltransferase family 4 protein [Akkermansiaceae bacterium]|nr:glycosyltransferase family 4 protein [Akkermansiaceae bacterium]
MKAHQEKKRDESNLSHRAWREPDDEVLAVVVPHSGQPTETFIRRYCEDLMPGRTVLIHFYEGAGEWSIDGPVFSLPKATVGSTKGWKLLRGVQKIACGSGLFSDPYTSWQLARFLRRHRVSAIFSQYLIAGWNVHPVVKRLNLRHVIRGHGFDVSSCLDQEVWRKRFRVLADADAIVVPSQFQVERLQSAGLQAAKITGIPYGVELPLIESRMPGRSEDDGKRNVRVLAVGRMVAKKSPLNLVKAFLEAAHIEPRLRLTYIGGGELEHSVRDFLRENDRCKCVELVGSQTHQEVLATMRTADIFAQHSVTDPCTGDQEGAPVAILEAMATSLPIVSTKHSGIPYLVEDQKSGLLSPEGDVKGMARSLVKLARDPELRQLMGARGYELAGSLTWAREREALLKLLFPGNTK